MARPKLQLEAFALAASPAPAELPVATPEQVNFPASGKSDSRASRPHVSLYVDKAVQKAIKTIALEYDRRPHDLYIEALDLLLRQYGRPSVAEMSGK